MKQCDRDLIDGCDELDVEKVRAALAAGGDVHLVDDEDSLIVHVLNADGYCEGDGDEGEREEEGAPSEEELDPRRQSIILLLLEHGADINEKVEGSWTTMQEAVHSSPRMVEFLLQHGGDPNQSAQWFGDEAPALQHAWGDEIACRGNPELERKVKDETRLMFEYGARPNLDNDLDPKDLDIDKIRSFDGIPPRIYPVMPTSFSPLTDADRDLYEACKNFDIEAVRRSVEKGANVNARDESEDFETPLFVAVKNMDLYYYHEPNDRPTKQERLAWREKGLSIVRYLLDNGADLNIGEVSERSTDKGMVIEGATPLQQAAWLQKDVELSRILMEHGANPNFVAEEEEGETIRDMNNVDYNVDNPMDVKPIEDLLNGFGGCTAWIFSEDAGKDLSMPDKALVFACQRMDYYAVQLAVKCGGNLAVREWGHRCLPVIVMDDAPQLKGKHFAKNGWDIEEEIVNFVMFLLMGMSMPLGSTEIADILYACVKNGYEKLLAALLHHHKYGPAFVLHAKDLNTDAWPWDCWPEEKRRSLREIIAKACECTK